MLKNLINLRSSTAVELLMFGHGKQVCKGRQGYVNSFRSSSSVTETEKSVPDDPKSQGQDVERISAKPAKRKKNKPFVKNLFLGIFDKVVKSHFVNHVIRYITDV